MNGRVTIEDADGVKASGSITSESIEQLGLKEDGTAVAIVKATDVMVAVDERRARETYEGASSMPASCFLRRS